LTLSLEGELDLESVPVIRQLDAQISGGKALSLDLSEVTFMIHLACECS
jgi:anti-anti-sigma regulatory factor